MSARIITCTRIHTHTHMHTRTYTYTHAHAYIHIHTCARTPTSYMQHSPDRVMTACPKICTEEAYKLSKVITTIHKAIPSRSDQSIPISKASSKSLQKEANIVASSFALLEIILSKEGTINRSTTARTLFAEMCHLAIQL